MAQAASKVRRGIVGLMRREIQRHSREIFSRTPRLCESSHISPQTNPKPFSSSSFSRGASLVQKQLGHVDNSLGVGHSLLFSNVGKAIRGFRGISFSSQSEAGNSVARELAAGYRSGLQKLRLDPRLQHRRIFSSYFNKGRDSLARTEGGGVVFRGFRAYHVDSQGMQHFKKRGPSSWAEKLATQQSMGWILVLGGGGVVVYVTNRQTVPYTHRKHFVLISPKLERGIGDQSYQMVMKEFKTKVLPPNHPESVRVHHIADQIIEALMLGVGSSDFSLPENASHDLMQMSKDWDSSPQNRPPEKPSLLEPYDSHTHSKGDEILDEKWVEKSRKDGLQAGDQGYTKHLDGMKWKVVVVDDQIVNAICIPGGKIVVFTGLLNKFRSDAEVATVVAHEVGHAVARHSAESLTQNIFIVALQVVLLSVFYVPELVSSVSELLLRLPFSRRMEIEADHIGLMLMAAAGYDPRLAPGFYEKLGQLEKVPEYAQYMSTHPSGKKRGELLRKSATMEEALRLYHQKMAGQETEGFF